MYHLDSPLIESQVPLPDNLCGVAVDGGGSRALVSYKGMGLPQEWTIDMVSNKARLALVRTYVVPNPVDLSGKAYFGYVVPFENDCCQS